MKFKSFLFVFLIPLVFASCGKDHEVSKDDIKEIVKSEIVDFSDYKIDEIKTEITASIDDEYKNITKKIDEEINKAIDRALEGEKFTEVKNKVEKEIDEISSRKDFTNIEKIVNKEIEKFITTDRFYDSVELGIQRFIKKQEEEQRKATEEANKPKKVEGVSIDDDPIKGDKDAPVTIIEFSDYECPFCSRHFKEVEPLIKERYIDTGRAKLVFRDFPLDFHKRAIPAAIAANCVREQGGDEKYFKMHDLLFDNPGNLSDNDLEKHALSLDIDKGKYESCITSDVVKKEIEKDMQDGIKYGVSGTPGFFINGWFIRGAFPIEKFDEYMEIAEKELKEKK